MIYFDPEYQGRPFLKEANSVNPAYAAEKLVENIILASDHIRNAGHAKTLSFDRQVKIRRRLTCIKTGVLLYECFVKLSFIEDTHFTTFAVTQGRTIALDVGLRPSHEAMNHISYLPYLDRSRARLSAFLGIEDSGFSWTLEAAA